MSYNISDDAFVSAMLSICKRVDSPRAKMLSSAIASRQACDMSFETRDYSERVSFSEEYMLSKILSKWKGWKQNGKSPKERAYDEWYSVEAECRQTNRRLSNLMSGSGFPGTYLITVISTAQSIAQEILGNFSLPSVLKSCKWGPGATSDLRRGTYRDKKMTQNMSTTPSVLPYMKIIIENDPNWIEAITGFYPEGPVSLVKSFWKLTDSAKLTTVPKKYDIDRTIDMQPTANGFIQQGTGQYIRRRLLLRAGIDLRSQEVNQVAAFEAVFMDDATLDLKGASDSVARSLCTLLLTKEWDQWFHTCRTSSTIGPYGAVKLEKLSSMGNAFTFELETLLFYSITKAVCIVDNTPWDRVKVYGDDIVCPKKVYDNVVYALNYLGFTVNQEKSFSSGDFYESCGKHYFRSDDVTPIYQKSLVNSKEEMIRFYNRLVRWSDRVYGDPWYFEEALTQIISAFLFSGKRGLSFDKLPRLPLGSVSDDGFLFPSDSFAYDSNGGFYTYVYRRQKDPAWDSRVESAYLALKLSSRVPNSNPKGYVYEDTGRGRYLISRSYFYRQ